MRALVVIVVAGLLTACGGSNEIVRGYLVAPENGPVRLCEELLESYPPQCGVPLVVVAGLELESVPGLVSTDDPDLAQVTWSEREVELTGTVADGVLTVR